MHAIEECTTSPVARAFLSNGFVLYVCGVDRQCLFKVYYRRFAKQVKMYNVELLSTDPTTRAKVQRRRDAETERRERIFNDKVRTIGVDKEALDSQIKEKTKREVAVKVEQDAFDAYMLHNSKLACLVQRRQAKEKRVIQKALDDYRHQYQQPQNNPDHCKKTELGDGEMTLTGLVGEDLDCKSRQQRQTEQLRAWLIQQQNEKTAEKHLQILEGQHYDQSRADIDTRALQLQNAEMEKRRAAAVATKECLVAMIRTKEQQRQLEAEVQEPSSTRVGVPGLCPSNERSPPQSLQQIIQLQKCQIEEKRTIELEKKQEEEQYDRVRVESARTALLMERQQKKLDKQLRQQLDSANLELAQTRKERRPDIERGNIDEGFFSKFNTSSR
ncbi:uncharacterized protein V6R79_023290 [Siganus canaliculatus]